MLQDETQPIHDKLEKAEHRLEAALGEVCEDPLAGGVRKPDTSELIKIDEQLALASEAAKQAISLRRQLHKKPTKQSAKDRQDRPSGRAD